MVSLFCLFTAYLPTPNWQRNGNVSKNKIWYGSVVFFFIDSCAFYSKLAFYRFRFVHYFVSFIGWFFFCSLLETSRLVSRRQSYGKILNLSIEGENGLVCFVNIPFNHFFPVFAFGNLNFVFLQLIVHSYWWTSSNCKHIHCYYTIFFV